MKCSIFFVSVLSFCVAACTLDNQKMEPELASNIQTVTMCSKEVGVPYTWQNLQLRNTGKEALIISNIEIRGDANCAFECYREPADGQTQSNAYPCPRETEGDPGFQMTVWPGDTRLVRIVYTASGDGVTDQATLIITSNAANIEPEDAKWKALAIPMCGLGIDSETLANMDSCEDEDAGVDASCDAQGDLECPACQEILPQEAPGCHP